MELTSLQEYFADYAPLLPCLFSLNHLPTVSKPLCGSSPNSWDNTALEHSVQGIIAVLLSLKKKPVIRYEKMSGMARKLANEVQVSYLSATMLLYLYFILVQSIVSKQSRPYSISGLRRWHRCYSSLIGETILSHLYYLSGHIRPWCMNFSASRMEELTSAWFLTSDLNFLQVHFRWIYFHLPLTPSIGNYSHNLH